MRLWLCFLTLFITNFADAAKKSTIYQVTYELSAKDAAVKTASLILAASHGSEITTKNGAERESLRATVYPAKQNMVRLDYRFKSVKNGKSFTLAKTALALAPGTSEINTFKDFSGNEFQLKITVVKK
ncbi:MAG: hypothetical protein AB7K41_16410 [Bdellovibrionales bacterium]